MNLYHLCLLQAVALIEAARTDAPESESGPAEPSSTRTMPMFHPTFEDLGLGPTPEEMARLEREMQLPGPMNRKQKREAARNARRSVVRRMR